MIQIAFILFVILNSVVCDQENCSSKIYKAYVHRSQWPTLKSVDRCNYVDVFARTPLRKGYFNVTFRAGPKVLQLLKRANVHYETLVEDVSSILKQDAKLSRKAAIIRRGVVIPERPTYDDIIKLLKSLTTFSQRGKKISVTTIGKSFQNRSIPMLKIEYPGVKNIMFIDAGIHAREWISIMTALYLAVELSTATTDTNKQINWYIIPSINPDGYVESYTNNRLQRKNMNYKGCEETCDMCGVDLNRNFGYKYGVSGASPDTCSEDYRGPHAYSEPESRALRDVLTENSKKIKVYLSLHCFGPMVLYPWGYIPQPVDDWRDLEKAGQVVADAINRHSPDARHPFEVLNSGRDLYPAAGGSDDYAKSINIKYAYTIELQAGGDTGFDPTVNEIRKCIKANYYGFVAMAKYITSLRRTSQRTLSNLSATDKKKNNCFLAGPQFKITVYILFYAWFIVNK